MSAWVLPADPVYYLSSRVDHREHLMFNNVAALARGCVWKYVEERVDGVLSGWKVPFFEGNQFNNHSCS